MSAIDLSASLAGLGLAAPSRLERQLEEAVRGDLEIVRLIAKGAMGLVFLARDVRLRRDVAIKVLMSDSFTTEQEVLRFKREAQTIAALDHEAIVPVYAVREHEELILFIMQYIDGETLEQRIGAGPLPIEEVTSILTRIGDGLHHAHQNDIVHRDVKPANIIVDRTGRAYITDFGVAKVADRNDLTMAGTLVGTPIYASPEQCRGESGGPASDQYALGVLAYEMLTATPPFQAETLADMIGHHTGSVPPPITDRRPDCPARIEAAVLRMLAKAPTDRWPSVAHAIRGLNGDETAEETTHVALVAVPTSSGRERPDGPRRRRRRALVLALAPLAVILAALRVGVDGQWRPLATSAVEAATEIESSGRPSARPSILPPTAMRHDPRHPRRHPSPRETSRRTRRTPWRSLPLPHIRARRGARTRPSPASRPRRPPKQRHRPALPPRRRRAPSGRRPWAACASARAGSPPCST